MMRPEYHLMPRASTSRFIRRAAVAALASAAAAVAAGCGTASTTTASSSARGAPRGTATTGQKRAGTATTPGTPTTPAAAGGACRTAELVLSYLGGQGATGHGELSFGLRNRGRRTCRARGYPAVRFLDHAGRPLSIVPIQRTDDFFGHSLLRTLSVPPGASISFRLDVSHGSGSPGVCPTAASVSVIPPGDAHALSTPITGGAYACRPAIVSPLQPGRAARA